jgi:hypothetical protein
MALAGLCSADGAYLDLTSLTTGTSGSFTGTLGPVSVTGAITTSNLHFQINGTSAATVYESSNTNNSSPQFSYSNIFTPSIAATDKIGYTSANGTVNPVTITVSFSAPVSDPILEVANVDGTEFNFSATPGISLVLLSGNGGGGDGILVTGDVVSDADPATNVAQNPSQMPLTSGPRSAYGSIELLGTFTSLTFGVNNPTALGDGASFTLATIPEPSSFALFGSAAVVLVLVFRKRLVRRS